MLNKLLKQLKKDFKQPTTKSHDHHYDDIILTEQERVALKNLLSLCRERIWIGRGRDKSGVEIPKFIDAMTNDQANLADQCVQYMELFLKRSDRHAEEN